ncbi:MAG: methyltransferase domain-containing protein [Chloroflexi bacterium]|nr:methyltransferase domain-containing protein [Chloroflexota bacterium]
MNWHNRYVQQSTWTRSLRAYLFEQTGLSRARRVLEVGCGTGAILSTLETTASLHGLDLAPDALTQCRIHAPAAPLTRGNALHLPYPDQAFDITYCHFLLLWIKAPLHALLEMKRVTRPNGNILALAEPDHDKRIDKPDELAILGKWQAQSLKRQGANPGLGAQLAYLFHQAGIHLVETGTIQSRGSEALKPAEWENEWAVLEADLADIASGQEIQQMKRLDKRAWARRERVLDVPTYFAWGQV